MFFFSVLVATIKLYENLESVQKYKETFFKKQKPKPKSQIIIT